MAGPFRYRWAIIIGPIKEASVEGWRKNFLDSERRYSSSSIKDNLTTFIIQWHGCWSRSACSSYFFGEISFFLLHARSHADGLEKPTIESNREFFSKTVQQRCAAIEIIGTWGFQNQVFDYVLASLTLASRIEYWSSGDGGTEAHTIYRVHPLSDSIPSILRLRQKKEQLKNFIFYHSNKARVSWVVRAEELKMCCGDDVDDERRGSKIARIDGFYRNFFRFLFFNLIFSVIPCKCITERFHCIIFRAARWLRHEECEHSFGILQHTSEKFFKFYQFSSYPSRT